MNRKPKIESLDNIFWIVQLDSFINKFDHEMGKENKRIISWLKIAGIPFAISIGISLITTSFIPVIIGTSYFGGVSIVKMIKDDIAYEKHLREKYSLEPKSPFKKESEVADFDFLNEPIVSVKAEDYHSEYYKQRLSEAAKRNKLTLVDSNGKVIGGEVPKEKELEEEPIVLNKEETMIQVSDEYRTYQIAYNLPELTIKNKEWDILFDTVYHKLEETSTESKLYDYMSFLLRYVIAYALIHKQKDINFKSFIDQIPRLEYLGISKKDIKDIESVLKENLPKTKVIPIDFLSLRKTKK